MITIPSPAYFDNSQPPVDDRTHEQIEQDAAEHAQWVATLNYKAPEPDAIWDAVNQKRLAEKNQHVHPVFRDVLKRFG